MKKILLSLSILSFVASVFAQTPADKCLSNITVPSYINCGTSSAFNLSGEFTLEAWINPASFGDDRKLFGKTNNSFNSGFVFGLQEGIYAEFWQPARTELKVGTLPSFYSWVHVAITFKPGGNATGYINGQAVGTSAVGATNLANNSEDFIIGIAPWDFGALMFLGQIDEIRIWNKERTAAQIQDNLHKQLKGNENDLVALYNLNEGTGTSATNTTVVTNLNGTITGSTWSNSLAIIGDSMMHTQSDVKAIWLGMNNSPVEDVRIVSTVNGLSVVTKVDTLNYLMFGHNDGAGISFAGLPQIAIDQSAERTDRTWFFDVQTVEGSFKSQFVFDLSDAASGGTELNDVGAAANYTLYYRTSTSADFTAVCAANLFNAGKVIFDSVNVESGYYAIGVSNNPIVESCDGSVIDTTDAVANAINYKVDVYPNPAEDVVNIRFEKLNGVKTIQIYNAQGKIVETFTTTKNDLSINVEAFTSGLYTVKVGRDNQAVIRKISIR